MGGAMYRARVHFFPKTMEAYGEAMQAGEEWSKLCAEKGWVEPTYWMTEVGGFEVIAEYDYPDLATYQRMGEESYAEPRAMAIMQKLMTMESTRPHYAELLTTAPSFT
jgi:hypothetical protein